MKDVIENALKESEIIYHTLRESDEQEVYKFGISLENGRYETVIDHRKEAGQVLFYTTCPTKIPKPHRIRVAEYLTRANYGLVIGNFELDMSDGDVRYKCVVIFDEYTVCPIDIFMRYLVANFRTMDNYLPGLLSVVFGSVLPSAAITMVEESSDPNAN